MKKKIVSLLVVVTIICTIMSVVVLQTFAHNSTLDISYDNCIESKDSDAILEMWYVLSSNSDCCHLSHQVSVIKYYFGNNPNSGESWADIADSAEIQEAYANSMKKWNDVYFYSYDSFGNVIKNKIIDIVEGTENDHNLFIYPDTNTTLAAYTGYYSWYMPETDTNIHKHCISWEMGINTTYFSANSNYGIDIITAMREKTGAHEIGHILGLRDIDVNNLCGADADEEHHYELLMGYGEEILDRAQNITYKDIAGVAITRGFHTDADHKWLNQGLRNDGKYKLVCAICNGIKIVDSLNGYSCDTFNHCGGHHSLSSDNMMAVASYGTEDYYKCKYCRYVAPFSSIVAQNYSKTNYSHEYHKCVNNTVGLEYTFYEEHTIVNNQCTECNEYIHDYGVSYEPTSSIFHKAYCACGAFEFEEHVMVDGECELCGEVHVHEYTEYEYYSNTQHVAKCPCGEIGTDFSAHTVGGGIGRFKKCIFCGGLVDTFSGPNQLESTINMVTANGSYILPNGVIVLVDEDIEAYLNGTLVFYNRGDSSEAA